MFLNELESVFLAAEEPRMTIFIKKTISLHTYYLNILVAGVQAWLVS